jgi:DNA helicase MCM8
MYKRYIARLLRVLIQLGCTSKYLISFFLAAGIVLALFGGVQKHVMDKNKVPVRGTIHVIIVGKMLNYNRNLQDTKYS